MVSEELGRPKCIARDTLDVYVPHPMHFLCFDECEIDEPAIRGRYTLFISDSLSSLRLVLKNFNPIRYFVFEDRLSSI